MGLSLWSWNNSSRGEICTLWSKIPPTLQNACCAFIHAKISTPFISQLNHISHAAGHKSTCHFLLTFSSIFNTEEPQLKSHLCRGSISHTPTSCPCIKLFTCLHCTPAGRSAALFNCYELSAQLISIFHFVLLNWTDCPFGTVFEILFECGDAKKFSCK
jgi:hypothetical protein